MEGNFVARFMSSSDDIECIIEFKATESGIEYVVKTNEEPVIDMDGGLFRTPKVVNRHYPVTDRRVIEFVEILTNSCFGCEHSSWSCFKKRKE